DRFWRKREDKLKAIGYNKLEVLTIASIVEEETNMNDEKPIVAAVYINRLKKGMPLQADPTIKFALGDFTIKRIVGKMLGVESPYNTYRNLGLPPAPICIPSIASIDAVLNYEKNDYLFFCAREDFSGYHNFTSDIKEHYANARKYQAALNELEILE
ncbi:MAG: endolytic transglycosylase MltG, partial [Bacteroidales bacterium]|nr:endolytic transglycosylase MltG [Bacteroidales bacterium]